MDKQKNNDVKISVPWYGYVVFCVGNFYYFQGFFLRLMEFYVL